ncbi:MAG: hypothetical protein M0Z53_11900 [Thermaerobacter sp.]|nr:hypothetical protein [Thermaerobacter sp.]
MLALGLAGCGATTAVQTTIAPNGSGTIVWTGSDTASDIQSNGGLSLAQVTALLQHHAPPGATVSGPVVHNGQEVWTITDHFRSIRQLNQILQAATGARHFQPVTMQDSGVPWAYTYTIHDPDNGSGYQWHWVTQALQNAGNSQAGDWQSSASTDTLIVPWTVPSGQPSYAAVTNQLGQAPDFGVTWVPPVYRLTLQPDLGPHPRFTGTWTMRFSAAQRRAIRAWWHVTDPQAHEYLSHGAPTWSAALTLTPGLHAPWGTLRLFTAAVSSTFWWQRHTAIWTFLPAHGWLLPSAWSSVGLHTAHGWNGAVTLAASPWSLPLLGRLNQHTSALRAYVWTGSATWHTLRWVHVAEVGGASLAAVALALWGVLRGRQRQRTRIPCACGQTNPPHTRFCTRCGQSLTSSPPLEPGGES